MKRTFFVLLLAALPCLVAAGDIQLPTPKTTGGLPLMEALSKRKSARAYDTRDLSPQHMADLLWAAFGVNREDGRRTAPSANNRQEIELHVLTREGSFVYDAAKNVLRQTGAEDVRASVNRSNAPLIIAYVADLTKRGEVGDKRRNVAAIDSAFIAQNIYLYCASEGLATVYRGGFDRTTLASKLGLKADQEILAVQPVGFPKA